MASKEKNERSANFDQLMEYMDEIKKNKSVIINILKYILILGF